jgi:hypothetical protein
VKRVQLPRFWLYPNLNATFRESCEFDFAAQRWKSDHQFIIKVSKALEDASREQHFRVQRPRLFVFNLATSTILPIVPRCTPEAGLMRCLC